MAAQPNVIPAVNLQPVSQKPRWQKLGSFKNVTNNVTDVFNIPLGPTIYKIMLHCKTSAGGNVAVSVLETDINTYRVKVNGDSFIEVTPEFLNKFKPYYGDSYGASTVAGIQTLPLAMEHLFHPAAVLQTAWGTANLDGLTVEIDFGTLTATTGLSGGTIDVWVYMEDVSAPLGLHRKIRKVTKSAGNTGEFEVMDLPLDGVLRYQAIHIENANVSSYRVKLGSQQIIDAVPVVVDQEAQESAKRNPQSGFRVLDFNLSNEIFGGVPILANPEGRKSLLIVPSYSSAPNAHNWYLETLESYNRAA